MQDRALKRAPDQALYELLFVASNCCKNFCTAKPKALSGLDGMKKALIVSAFLEC